MKRKMLLFSLALPFISLHNTQAQTASRLISEAHYTNDGAVFNPDDSTVYAYAGTRGGAHNLDPLNMDAPGGVSVPMPYDNATSYGFAVDSAYDTWYSLQTFDANNNVTSSIAESWDAGSAAWMLYSNTLYTYNSASQLTSSVFQLWDAGSGAWMPSSQEVYSYNAAGQLYAHQSNTWNSVTLTWDPVSAKTYYYDSSMNQVAEIDQAWSGGTPAYTYEWTRTYSAANQLLTTHYNTWNGTAWVFNTLYTHAYDSVGNALSLLIQNYDAVAAVWDNNTLYLYTNLTSAHMPQTVYRQAWDTTAPGSWVNDKMYTYTYNTSNQVTNITSSTWNVLGIYEYASGDQLDDYNYEAYSTTSVKNVTNNGGDASIYPIPAQGMLHVDLSWSEAQAATISILDMTGNVVRSWDAPAGTQYSSAVSVNNLASGMYIVKIDGQKGQIIKRIVVAH